MNISRRKFIRVASLSSLGALSVPLIIKGFDAIADADGARVNTKINNSFQPDIDLELTVQPLADTYLGPIIRVKPGQMIRVRFRNQLPRESIIHWHGLHISPKMDGH